MFPVCSIGAIGVVVLVVAFAFFTEGCAMNVMTGDVRGPLTQTADVSPKTDTTIHYQYDEKDRKQLYNLFNRTIKPAKGGDHARN